MIPTVNLDNDGSFVRVIAGDFNEVKGPAKTFTPINLWDVRLRTGYSIDLDVPSGFNTLLLVLNGAIIVNGAQTVSSGSRAQFENTGAGINLAADEDATVLVMSGQPIDEPVAGQGPFVMNTQPEINQAIADFRSGAF